MVPAVDTAIATPFALVAAFGGIGAIKYWGADSGSEGEIIRSNSLFIFAVAIVPTALFATSAVTGFVRTTRCRRQAGK